MTKSLKQLIKEVRAICDAHGQIKSFHYGETLRTLGLGELEYITCLMNVVRTGQNRSSTDVTIELLVLDRVRDGNDDNRLDSENITLRIIRDIVNTIGYSTRWRLFSDLLTQAPTQKFHDHLEDKATGHSVSITLQVYNDENVCDLPMFDYDFDQPIPEDECDVLAVVENTEGTQLVTRIITDSDNVLVVPNIQFTDSDGSIESRPSGVDLVCTPTPDSLQWVLNFDEDDYRINVVCDNTNQGQLNYVTYDDIGTLTYSTDNGATFNPFTVPFTAVSGTTYIFERSDTTNDGSVVLNGLANAVFIFDDSYRDHLIQHLLGGVGVVGSTWEDQTDNGNDAILVNNPTSGVDFLRLTKSSSQYVNLNHGGSMDEFTISLTVDYVTLTNQDRLLNQITNVSGTWSMYAVNNAFGAPRMEFYTNPAWHNCNFEPFVGNKYIIDITVNNNTNEIKVYVDSVLKVTIADNVSYTDLGIGNRYRGLFGNYLDAEIYEFRLYDTVLTQQQITDKNT